MALVVCKLCKKAFISGLQEEEFCPDCVVRLRELYPSVRNFLRNHDGELHTAQEVGKLMNIALEDVSALVSMGFLEFRVNREGEEAVKTANVTMPAKSNKH